MKLYAIILATIISGTMFAADSRHVAFYAPVAAMHKAVVTKQCADAETMLRDQKKIAEGEQATGTVATIYYGLRDLGYQAFADANRPVIQRSWEILDLFSYPFAAHNPATMAAADAFLAAAANPDDVDLWVRELKWFSSALIMLARNSNSKFALRIKISDRIALNHDVVGTVEEHAELAAHQMTVPIRFNQRFAAMKENVDTFRAFVARVPAVFAELEEELEAELKNS